MDIKAYKSQTKTTVVTLSGGEELEIEYFVNYLTLPVMESLSASMAKALEDDADLASQHSFTLSQLVAMLKTIGLTEGGKKLPFNTTKQKQDALNNLSTVDHRKIIAHVQEDLSGESKKTSTDSADG